MKTLQLFFAVSLMCAGTIAAQSRLVLNQNVFMNIKNDAYVVLDNSHSNAITLSNNGGNILSEKETNAIKWNVRNATGNFVVPFTNADAVKIPVEVNITNAGSSDGHLILSTYRTDEMNSQWPEVVPKVTNMCSMLHSGDASHSVIDRFWRIDVNSFTSKPAAILSLGYDFINEAGGDNIISGAPSLQAQRFNPDIGLPNETSCHGETNVTGNWESLMFGTPNITTHQVSNIVVSPSNFYKDWILTDHTVPLPISLINFDVLCENETAVLKWSTASETNNSYFIIEKSTAGVHFSKIGTVQGSGNSNTLKQYSYKDHSPSLGTVYYRLKQVDFNGEQETFNILSSNCSQTTNFEVNQETFGNNSLYFNVFTGLNETLNISLYDYSGRQIASQRMDVKKGENEIQLKKLNIVKGVYMLHIVGSKNEYSSKLFKY